MVTNRDELDSKLTAAVDAWINAAPKWKASNAADAVCRAAVSLYRGEPPTLTNQPEL
jgi:hypothetical protein